MKTVRRFDNHKIGKNVQTTPQGFLVIRALTARTGIQIYKDEKGNILKEFRPESEVFSDSSMSSLRTAIVTDGHPKQMVNPDNVKKHMVGFPNGIVTKETVDGEKEKFLGTHLIITHRDAIEAIQAGKAEISNGYSVDLEFTAGEHNGEKFDAIQRNITNNHIAIVWHGRAGNVVKLQLDHNDAILIDENYKPEKGETMKVIIHGKTFEVGDEVGKAIEDEKTETETKHKDALHKGKELLSAEEKKKKQLEKDKAGLEAKKDSLESDLEKAKKNEKTDGDVINVDEAVKTRITVMAVGSRMLDNDTVKKLDTMSNDDIKKAVIKADSPNVEDSKLEKTDYVDARFDHISENLGNSTKQAVELGKKIIQDQIDKKDDKGPQTADEHRDESMKKSIEASEQPIGRSLKV